MAIASGTSAPPPPQPPWQRRLALQAVFVAIVLACIEAPAFLAAKLFNQSGLIYDPSVVTQDYLAYLTKRNVDLGWAPAPPPPAGESEVAADGSRHDPAFPAALEPCMSLFGDSFTWSDEVDNPRAWGAVLAAKLDCRVANYGVGGYGSDQAYLRYRALPPRGKVVALNHLSENILRNVNQYRNLLYPGREFTFKPRFIVRGGAAELVPMPDIAPARIEAFKRAPALYLQHEYFLPGGPSGTQQIGFPHALTVTKAVLWHYHVRAKLANVPRHADFYRPDHASDGLSVTFEILRAFAAEATRRGQLPIVTVIPTCPDLRVLQSRGAAPYAALGRMLEAEKIRFVDFGAHIARRLQGASPDTLFGSCSAHFNAAGYALLADIMLDYLNADRELRSSLAASR